MVGYKKGEKQMKRRKIFYLSLLVFSVFSLGSFASTINLNVDDFAVFAGGKLSVSKDVIISGDVGSMRDMWINSRSKVDGAIYSGAKFSAGSEFSATGRIISHGSVGINSNANVMSIDSGGSLYVGSGSKVGALKANEKINISRYVTVFGDVGSNNSVGVNSKSVIHGDVIYGTNYWIHSSSKVDGTISKGNVEINSWTTEMRAKPNFKYGKENIYYHSNTDNSLAPGDYRRLSVDKGAVLRLSAGTYNFAKVWFDDNVQVIADTSGGDVLINVAGNLGADAGVKFQSVGDGAFTVQSLKTISLDNDVIADADFISFRNLSIDSGSQINGQLYAGRDIWLGKGVQVSGMTVSPDVPEPTTILLLSIGLFLVHKRRRIAM